ncbi:hypothetical protein AC482_01010 [miscellaneous Crenarchaeota group-15 archaeon DG-45]|uniref:3-dehydroquinate synthase n=1 Tax=miscellaneous Crenarchaeota group-15 archaeon DG-45 TaxID=1685127 RepID=A0A0M0BT49_9ARCH|nr:MAG: hypothetical protein AC482_01010 [miscellaneous Crenarchaeota group-15 archaeon DG-45]
MELGPRRYPIHVGCGILAETGRLMKERLPSTKCAIVSHADVMELHGGRLMEGIEEAGIEAHVVVVPPGEESKSWERAGWLHGALLDLKLDRASALLAFGGGVVGDLAGFVASTFMRGISLVQAPTPLLAQVDSGIGGKTAVNHARGKNLIGSFYQPRLVVVDPGLLETLPREERRSGLAEVVKYGVIADRELFELLEGAGEAAVDDAGTLEEIVSRCCAIKARFVEGDERDETGMRAALNLGHTLGHALEIQGKLSIRHGEAVAVGMLLAAEIAVRRGLMQRGEADRLKRLLKRLNLSTSITIGATDPVLEAMHRDKKAEAGTVRFVLPTGIGDAPVVEPISDAEVMAAIRDSVIDG